MALSAQEAHQLKLAPAVEGVIPAILNRWSARSFSDREVTPAELTTIFEAARWSASAFNEQPWSFVVGLAGSETHAKIGETLMGFNKAWATKAPVLILAVASNVFAHNGKENTYAMFDLGAAVAALTLQAAEQGMTTHTLAGFDPEAARTAFAIPANYTPGVVVALGYQGEPEALSNEMLIEKETSPRERKPIESIVLSDWGVPAEWE